MLIILRQRRRTSHENDGRAPLERGPQTVDQHWLFPINFRALNGYFKQLTGQWVEGFSHELFDCGVATASKYLRAGHWLLRTRQFHELESRFCFELLAVVGFEQLQLEDVVRAFPHLVVV